MAPSKDKRIIKFVITETDRHEKGFTIYKITSMIFAKSAPDIVSKISIWKRYSDFKKLYVALKPLHASLHIKESYPTFPKPKFFGRFEAEVIEERRACALNFLEFIARHTALFTSDVFVTFFEINELGQDIIDCSNSINSDTSEDDRNIREEKTSTIFRRSKDSVEGKTSSKLIDSLPVISRKIFAKKDSVKEESKKVAEKSQTFSNKSHTLRHSDATIECGKSSNEVADRSTIVIHDGSDLPNVEENAAQYILIAAAHMSAAFRHEAIAEYEEAFTQYKLGISHLLNGVQSDFDVERRTLIQEKITKYLQRAERLYNRHLNCNISVLNKPITELQNYKVFRVMGSMMLVKDTLRGFTRIIKTVEKIVGYVGDVNDYILRGKVPYMVQLHGCVQTKTTVFLILQYISKGSLWDFIKTHYKVYNSGDKKGHMRSLSCDAAIQVSLEKDKNVSRISTEKLDLECLSNKTSFINNHEESGTKSESFSKDVPTTQLLENAQRLLQSVNATLKRSNSIASRMNEMEYLLQDRKRPLVSVKLEQRRSQIKPKNGDISHHVNNWDNLNNTKVDYDLNQLSTSDSLTDMSFIKDKSTALNETYQSSVNSSICSSIEIESKISYLGNEEITLSQLCPKDNCIVDLEPAAWEIPESTVSLWAAEIICALEALHQQDVIVSHLKSDDILINDEGHVEMTYVVRCRHFELPRKRSSYVAPELCNFIPPVTITAAADVWSFGVLLYELLTGYQFQQKHSGEFHSHSIVHVPNALSKNAKSLLLGILKYQPSDRLTIPEIKQHMFFSQIDWLNLLSC